MHPRHGRPSAATLWTLAIIAVVIIVAAFFTGYLPQSHRQTALASEAKDDTAALPIVNVAPVEQSSGRSDLVLSGDIQAVTEAPVLARASGYIGKRYVDIGDRVKEGQLLAEIDAAELGEQVSQAKAAMEQAASGLEQATANLKQGKTNADMSRVTADRWTAWCRKARWRARTPKPIKSQSDAQRSNVQALEKAVNAAKSNVAVAESNLARLTRDAGISESSRAF